MSKSLNLDILKRGMDEAGLNPARLAKNLDVSREAVSKWLNGESIPRPDKLLKLALLLGLKFDQLVSRTDDAREPVVAFRKHGAHKTTAQHIDRAMEMGRLLRPLAQFLPFDELIRPATLKQPSCEYSAVQKVAAKIRQEIGVAQSDRLDFHHLIKKFRELQAVLIPVLWGKKDRHENALHIYLPDSLTTWVYLNLDSEIHDFKFWMAHELGHIHAPSLRGDEAEDLADTFAAALLFPETLAAQAYQVLAATGNKGTQMNRVKEIAETHVISPITVYFEVNKYAKQHGLRELTLGNAIFGAAKNLSKVYFTVSESLFDGVKPEPARYLETVEQQFDSPFFSALKQYLGQNAKGAGYVQSVLDTSLLDAKTLHAALI
ncbi:MAG: helix-turn-helix transcriptional regulator [Gammaproteobacteria bacterium]|nr:helix-turn-helix transcriptional regulator [Gammaproteobacteria bacterium]